MGFFSHWLQHQNNLKIPPDRVHAGDYKHGRRLKDSVVIMDVLLCVFNKVDTETIKKSFKTVTV